MEELSLDITPSGLKSALVSKPFDQAHSLLTANGFEVISLEEQAEQRILQGKEHPVSRLGNFVRNSVIYVPNKGNFLVPNSTILENPKKATDAHRKGNEYVLTQEQAEKSLQNSVEFPKENTDIPTNRFNEFPLTIHAFGNGSSEKAQAYGDFLRENKLMEMPIYVMNQDYVNSKSSTFERLVWFAGLDYWSNLYGDYGLYYFGSRVRGVSKSGEATRAEISPSTRNFSQESQYKARIQELESQLKTYESKLSNVEKALRGEQ